MKKNAPRAVDRRIERTRGALRDALLDLLQDHSWDDMGVQEICEHANIGRSTFYMHFQNKDELLAHGFNDLRTMLGMQDVAVKDKTAGQFPFLHGLIEHAGQHRKLFRSVIGRRSSHVVHLRFKEMVLQLFKDDLAHASTAGWQREATAHFLAGALVQLLAWWVDAKSAIPREEVEQYFRKLALPEL